MARVLIVEDDPNLRDLLAEVLQVEGHDVLKASDGEEGLRILLDKTPQLLLTDIVMPQMDGLGLLKILREFHGSRTGLRIIAISGAPDQSRVLEAASEMGATKVLAKPFSRVEFVDAVNAVLKA